MGLSAAGAKATILSKPYSESLEFIDLEFIEILRLLKQYNLVWHYYFDDGWVGYMIKGRRPGHEVLKNATCPTPGKARPTHEEVVHDDESGCNEDRGQTSQYPPCSQISAEPNFQFGCSSLLCGNFNCRAKQVGRPDAPGQDVGVSSPHLFPFLLAYPPALSQ